VALFRVGDRGLEMTPKIAIPGFQRHQPPASIAFCRS
jgi:hypothetical protein